MNLFTFPVIVGQGTRLFPDRGPDRALDLVDSACHPNGRDDPGLSPHRPPAMMQPPRHPRARDVGPIGWQHGVIDILVALIAGLLWLPLRSFLRFGSTGRR